MTGSLNEEKLTASGTAFAVSKDRIVTCSHNVKRDRTLFKKCVLVSKVVRFSTGDEFSNDQVPIKLIDHNVTDDWAVFERTDGEVFSNFLQVELVLPKPSTNLHFTIYHAPLNLLGELSSMKIVGEPTTLMMYDDKTVETGRTRTIFVDRFFVSTDGKCGGSSGAPVVRNGKVIAFHTSSFNEQLTSTNLKSVAVGSAKSGSNSDAPSYTGYSHATTISTLPDLMLLITDDVKDTSTKSAAIGPRPDRRCKR